MVGKTASIGFPAALCSSRIWMMYFFSSGSKYTKSALIGSVMIVAGLELMRLTSMPFLAQRPGRLRPGVIELAGLANDDGT